VDDALGAPWHGQGLCDIVGSEMVFAGLLDHADGGEVSYETSYMTKSA